MKPDTKNKTPVYQFLRFSTTNSVLQPYDKKSQAYFIILRKNPSIIQYFSSLFFQIVKLKPNAQ